MLDSSPVLRDNAVDESQEMVTLITEQKVSCILKHFFLRFAREDFVLLSMIIWVFNSNTPQKHNVYH